VRKFYPLTHSLPSDDNQLLVDWLKEKRVEQGHTMRTLSDLLCTPHSLVGKIENQERKMDVVEYVRYCAALDVDPTEGIKLLSDQVLNK